MQLTKRLEDPGWGDSAFRQVRLNLPKGKRVRRFSVYLHLTGTKDAADSLSADLWARALALIQLQGPEGLIWNLTGIETWRLNHYEKGRKVQVGTDIPASGTTFTMDLALDISFRRPNSKASDDGSIPVEELGNYLDLTFAAGNVWGVGNLKVTAGTVYVTPELVEETNVHEAHVVKYVDMASGLAEIEPGHIILSAFLVQTDYSGITSSEIGMLGANANGNPVHEANTTQEQLVTLWNQDSCSQSGSPHELVAGNTIMVPVVWMPREGANFTKQPMADGKGASVRITTGSLLTGRLVLRLLKLKTQEEANRIGQRIGAPMAGAVYEPAVASKSAVRAVHASIRQGAPNRKAAAIYAAGAGKFRQTPTALMPALKRAIKR